VSACQSRFLAHIYQCASRFARRHADSANGNSGSHEFFSKFSDPNLGSAESDSILFSRVSSYESDSINTYATNSHTPIIPIVADRVSLPSTAGSAALLDLLPPDLAAQYASFNPTLFWDPANPRPAPRPAFSADHQEYVKLVNRMYQLGMVKFVLEPKVVNGVFGVPKDGDKIRLIIDARPFNAMFSDPPKVQLPTPDLLAQLQVPSDAPFFVAKADVDNFYHRLRLPEWLVPYFALPAVRASEVGLQDTFGDVLIYPCCTTLPMGWSHSVYLAQRAHEHFIETHCPSFRDASSITKDSDCLLNRIRFLIYIDDLLLFGHCDRELSKLLLEYCAAAEKWGIPVKLSKRVLPTSQCIEGLGLELNGTEHLVGVSVEKLHCLCLETVDLLRGVECTGLEMARLVGKWTWACLVNRPSLAVFNSVYHFTQAAQNRRFCIWDSVRTELHCIIGLAPLLFAKLDSEWFPQVLATDASETGFGVVCAAASPAVQTSLASQAAVIPRESYTEQSVLCKVNLRWRTLFASRWQREEHITVLELRALSAGVRWALSSPRAFRRKLLLFCDSLPVLGAVNKGRSSTHSLLPRLRVLAGYLLAGGLRVVVKWIPTELNPADEPSRQ
jgi:hypothetical protein